MVLIDVADILTIGLFQQVRLLFWSLFTDRECIQGRTHDSNFQEGGGGAVFPGDGVPTATAHSYRNPLSIMIGIRFSKGGGGSGHPLWYILAYPKMEWAYAVGV